MSITCEMLKFSSLIAHQTDGDRVIASLGSVTTTVIILIIDDRTTTGTHTHTHISPTGPQWLH